MKYLSSFRHLLAEYNFDLLEFGTYLKFDSSLLNLEFCGNPIEKYYFPQPGRRNVFQHQ